MKISVIIPTNEHRGVLLAAVYAVCFQSAPIKEYEVFVLDGGAASKEDEALIRVLMRSVPQVKLIQQKGSLASLCNSAAKEAKGEYLLFLAPHCMPNRDWISSWKSWLQEHACAIAEGGLTMLNASSKFGRTEVEYDTKQKEKAHNPKVVDFHHTLIRRVLFLKEGGFNPRLNIMAIDEFSARMSEKGMRVKRAPISVAHSASRGVHEFMGGVSARAGDMGLIYKIKGTAWAKRYFPLPTLAKYQRGILQLRIPLMLFCRMMLWLALKRTLVLSSKRSFAKAALWAHREGVLRGLG